MLEAAETFKLKPLYAGRHGLGTPKPAAEKKTRVLENNKLRLNDRAAHQWYRFVLSFPPHLVRDYVAKFGLNSHHSLLDPFCGTGTTLVECKKLGIPAFGLEPNPVACFASQTKLQWGVDPQNLLRHAMLVGETANRQLKRDGYFDSDDLRLLDHPVETKTNLRILPEAAGDLLLTNSISPIPLHKTLVLLEALAKHHDERFANHERLALATALVNGISNLHFGPEVGVGPAKSDAPVISLWFDGIRAMVQDLENLPHDETAKAVVYQADAREGALMLPPNSIDAVITSPPYPNEKDYTRTTRLESVLLGFIQSKEDLRNLKKRLVRSNTRGVYKTDTDDNHVTGHAQIEQIAAAIEKRRIELNKDSGFERLYARVPKSIQIEAPKGKTWIIRPAGQAKYRFVLVPDIPMTPNPSLSETKVPDATPGIVTKYAFNDEQARRF